MLRQYTTYIISIFAFLFGIFVVDACSKRTLKESLNKLKRKEIKAIRGVHIPHERLSDTEKMTKALDFCEKMQVNAIFIQVWDKGEVAFPSEVMKNSANIAFNPEKYNHANPLKFFIEQAHKRKLKVFTIFDFELDYKHHKTNTKFFKKYPERIALNAKKRPAMRFDEQQLNMLNTDVQEFTKNLILEMAKFYKPDGIRINTGLTVESGYDKVTVQRYVAENHGKNPPNYARDFEWVEWRTNVLTDYTETLYRAIKKSNPKILIAVMSNEYPKCKAENLRDWIHQVRGGYTDVISPRLYRENLNLYQENLDNLLKFQVDKAHLSLVYPDITPEDPKIELPQEVVENMISEHRKRNIEGEIIPYNLLVAYQDYFKKTYKYRAVFPKEVEENKWKKRKNLIHRKAGQAGVADAELEAEEATENLDEEMSDEDQIQDDEISTDDPIDDTQDMETDDETSEEL